jgi:hypothetical protein
MHRTDGVERKEGKFPSVLPPRRPGIGASSMSGEPWVLSRVSALSALVRFQREWRVERYHGSLQG